MNCHGIINTSLFNIFIKYIFNVFQYKMNILRTIQGWMTLESEVLFEKQSIHPQCQTASFWQSQHFLLVMVQIVYHPSSLHIIPHPYITKLEWVCKTFLRPTSRGCWHRGLPWSIPVQSAQVTFHWPSEELRVWGGFPLLETYSAWGCPSFVTIGVYSHLFWHHIIHFFLENIRANGIFQGSNSILSI